MEEMEVVALAARCGQGWPLALGGICRAGYGARWRRQLAALRPALTAADLYMLDVQLARALSAAADETLWVAGASLRRPGLPLSPGQSTGGVIGDPGQAPASSPDGGERLDHGLSLYTAPGGPGLAAPAGPEQLAAAANRVRALPRGRRGRAAGRRPAPGGADPRPAGAGRHRPGRARRRAGPVGGYGPGRFAAPVRWIKTNAQPSRLGVFAPARTPALTPESRRPTLTVIPSERSEPRDLHPEIPATLRPRGLPSNCHPDGAAIGGDPRDLQPGTAAFLREGNLP